VTLPSPWVRLSSKSCPAHSLLEKDDERGLGLRAPASAYMCIRKLRPEPMPLGSVHLSDVVESLGFVSAATSYRANGSRLLFDSFLGAN
jgi:hypothetical protein